MTQAQQYLLRLLEEFDTICKENNIKYCLAGGTLIGAVRHRGFVPWDDDVDVYMTRDEFNKLVKIYTSGGFPNGRVLECQEANRNYINTFGRYEDITSTAIHKSQIVTEDYAGEVLDILQLDPIPNGKFFEKHHWNNLTLYSDLINPASPYSHRTGKNYLRYCFYNWLSKRTSKDFVLKILEKQMFCHRTSKCKRYMMRWGGAPLLFPYEMFDELSLVSYEHLKVYIPSNYNSYLTYHYGDEWYLVPHVEEQMGHEAVHNMYYSYTEVRNMYKEYINVDEVFGEYAFRKKEMLKHSRDIHRVADTLVRCRGAVIREELLNDIKTKRIDCQKKYELAQYKDLAKVFADYYKAQNSPAYSGRDTYVGIYRYLNPILIDLPNDILLIALKCQFDMSSVSKTFRIIEIYENNKSIVPKSIRELKRDILLFRTSQDLYFSGEYKESIILLKDLLVKYPNNIFILKLYIRCLLSCGCFDGLNTYIEKGLTLSPTDGEFIKYQADVLYDTNLTKALELYKYAYENTQNGIIHLEIKDIFRHEIEHMLDDAQMYVKNLDFDKANKILSRIKSINSLLNMDLYSEKMFIKLNLQCNRTIDFSLWEYWKEHFQNDDEYFKLGELILVSLEEPIELVEPHLCSFKATNSLMNVEEVLYMIDSLKRISNNAILLDKYRADILASRGLFQEAYDMYHDLIKNIDSNTLEYREIVVLFKKDIDQYNRYYKEYGNNVFLIKNIEAKYGSIVDLGNLEMSLMKLQDWVLEL